MYASLDDLKRYLKVKGNEDDALLQKCLTAAIDKIDEQFTARWEPASATRYFNEDCLDGNVLQLDYPLLSVTELKNGDGTILDSSDYVLLPRNAPANSKPYDAISLKNSQSWTFSTDGWIEVTGDWAFTAKPPGTVVITTLRLAAYYYRIKDDQTFGSVANSDFGTISFPPTIPKDVQTALDGLRRAYDLAGWCN